MATASSFNKPSGTTSRPSQTLPATLAFSDPSNHRDVRLQMFVSAVLLVGLGWIATIGVMRGQGAWAWVLSLLVLISVVGWLRALSKLARPFEYHVEFGSAGIEIWNTQQPNASRWIPRQEITQVLLERSGGVSIGIRSSRLAQGIPGIHWTAVRLAQLDEYLIEHWPEMRVDRI